MADADALALASIARRDLLAARGMSVIEAMLPPPALP